jgi:hypothetical protein
MAKPVTSDDPQRFVTWSPPDFTPEVGNRPTWVSNPSPGIRPASLPSGPVMPEPIDPFRSPKGEK